MCPRHFAITEQNTKVDLSMMESSLASASVATTLLWESLDVVLVVDIFTVLKN